jgi:hypothetical protein
MTDLHATCGHAQQFGDELAEAALDAVNRRPDNAEAVEGELGHEQGVCDE